MMLSYEIRSVQHNCCCSQKLAGSFMQGFTVRELIDILHGLDCPSNYSTIQKLKRPVIAVTSRPHEMRRFVYFLFLN